MIETISLHPGDHLLFFLFGIVMPLRSVKAQSKLKDISFNAMVRIQLYIGNSIGLWIMALVVLLVWWFSGRTLSQLGLTWTPAALSGWGLTLILAFFLLYLMDTGWDLYTEKGREDIRKRLRGELALLPRSRREYRFFIPLALSAGICEEILFRGYFINYFLAIFGAGSQGKILSVFIPATIFGLVHFYQGGRAMAKILLMAVLFGAAFVFTGSLLMLIILHAVVDLIGGSIGLWFEPGEESPPASEWDDIYPEAGTGKPDEEE